MESSIRGIWLTSKNSDIFSKGTDFKCKKIRFFQKNYKFFIVLHQSIFNKKPENAYNYLRNLYDFGVFLGKYNKPILLNLKGEISKKNFY